MANVMLADLSNYFILRIVVVNALLTTNRQEKNNLYGSFVKYSYKIKSKQNS